MRSVTGEYEGCRAGVAEHLLLLRKKRKKKEDYCSFPAELLSRCGTTTMYCCIIHTGW